MRRKVRCQSLPWDNMPFLALRFCPIIIIVVIIITIVILMTMVTIIIIIIIIVIISPLEIRNSKVPLSWKPSPLTFGR